MKTPLASDSVLRNAAAPRRWPSIYTGCCPGGHGTIVVGQHYIIVGHIGLTCIKCTPLIINKSKRIYLPIVCIGDWWMTSGTDTVVVVVSRCLWTSVLDELCVYLCLATAMPTGILPLTPAKIHRIRKYIIYLLIYSVHYNRVY